MISMQNEISLNRCEHFLLNFLETSLKHRWNTLETPLKYWKYWTPCNLFETNCQTQNNLKKKWNFLETLMNPIWNFIQNSLNHLKTLLKHNWTLLEIELFCPIWTYLDLFKYIWIYLDLFGPLWTYSDLFGVSSMNIFTP